MSYIQKLFADRIGGNNFGKDTTLYKFEKIKRAKKLAKEKYPDLEIIDMGVGEPDSMAEDFIIEELNKQAKNWENRGYADNGIDVFQKAAATYLKNVFNVNNIDPYNEINHSIGAKPALAMIAQAFINPGDITLTTIPGYPIISTMTKWLGGEVFNLPLKEENNFLPDLDNIPKNILKQAKLLYINYPNNPTGAVANEEFYKKVIKFARENNIVVVQDAAYAGLTFDQEKPLSFLSIEGAKDVGIEIHSLSKSFNMTGWRLGFVAGNSLIVKAFASVKDNNDSGQFKAIQYAGACALNHYEITEKTSNKYSRRHDILVETLKKLGFNVKKPKATFYLYVKIPKRIKNGEIFNTAEDFSQYLIKEKLISTVPWDDEGNFIRLSVTFVAKDEDDEKRVIEEIYSRLKDVEFEF